MTEKIIVPVATERIGHSDNISKLNDLTFSETKAVSFRKKSPVDDIC